MNKAGQLADRLLRLDLLILDELGYLPFSPSGGALLFHLLSKLYERTSVSRWKPRVSSQWKSTTVPPVVVFIWSGIIPAAWWPRSAFN